MALGCLALGSGLAAAESLRAPDRQAKGQDDKRPETEFHGIVQKMPLSGLVGDWQVGGRTLHVTSNSEVRQDHAAARVGGCAQVKGVALVDGSVEGTRVDMQRSIGDCGDSGAFRDDQVESRGLLQSLPSAGLVGEWNVAGRIVIVSASTVVNQESETAGVGACVEIKGQLLPNNAIAASRAELKPSAACTSGEPDSVEAYGLVRKMPANGWTGDWQIGDWIYHVQSAAAVKQDAGPAMLGACVQVRGDLQADNSISVQRLEVKSASGMCISPRGVLSAASFQGGRVSPGELIALFGFSIGPSVPGSFALSDDGRIATSAGGVRVFFDDSPAPIMLGSMNQINAIVPYSISGKPAVRIEIEYNGSKSNALTTPVSVANPALFTADSSGHGRGLASHEDGSANSPLNPAPRGSVVEMYATGWGPATRNLEDGATVADGSARAAMPVSVSIGGREAEVLYAGAAPDRVAAMAQIRFRVPDDCPSGSDVPVVLRIGAESSQAGVTLAVQ